MKLQTWLTERNKSLTEFSNEIGVSVEAVRRYACGARIPRPAIMSRIVEVTGGAVAEPDFYRRAEAA